MGPVMDARLALGLDPRGASMIPDYMRYALAQYINNHKMPGGFLQAVLENNLKEATARADDINMHSLHLYVRYLYNYAPLTCWGSPTIVTEWIKQGQEKE